MLDLLVRAAAAAVLAGSLLLAGRALYAFYHAACDAAHGAAGARRRMYARRMRMYTIAGLVATAGCTLALTQSGLSSSGARLQLTVLLLAASAFAFVSARASRRASRPGNKRRHVQAQMRTRRFREAARQYAERSSHERRRQQRRRARQQRQRQGGDASQQQHSGTSSPAQPETVRRALRTLGLPSGASRDEIRRAWRQRAFRHHPDRHQAATETLRTEHAEAFRQARRAYELLSERDSAAHEA